MTDKYTQAGAALAEDQNTGLTHMVWNQDGQVYAAYYEADCGRWVDAFAIPGSTTGLELQLSGNVALLGADGSVMPALLATWASGTGNATQIYGSVGQASPLGGYNWSQPKSVPQELRMATSAPGGERVVLDARDFTYGGEPVADFVIGSNLPGLMTQGGTSVGGFFPPNSLTSSYNFDLAIEYGTDTIPLTGKLPLVGGRSIEMELSVRLRGGYLTQGSEFTSFGDYDLAGTLTSEIELSLNLFDMVSLTGSVQGTFAFGGLPGSRTAPTAFLGGQLTEGLQATIEYSPPGWSTGDATGDDFLAKGAIFFNIDVAQTNTWAPSSDPAALGNILSGFAELVRADGSPAQVGDDASALRWSIDPSVLANLMIGSLGGLSASASTAAQHAVTPAGSLALEGAPAGGPVWTASPSVPLSYSSLLELTPGIGGFFEVKLGSFAEGKATLGLYFDFVKEDDGPFGYSSVRAALDIEAKIGWINVSWSYEWVIHSADDQLPTVRVHQGASYNPLPGAGTLQTPEAILSTEGSDGVPHSLAVAADGSLLLAWVQDAPNDTRDLTYVAVSRSVDNGRTWSTPHTLEGSAGLNIDPVASFDAEGRGVVVWNNGDATALASKPPGHAYVVFGSQNLNTVGTLGLGDLDGRDGFALTGGALMSAIGGSVAAAGDLDGDGRPDLMVGAPGSAVNSGKAYVVLGRAALGLRGEVDVTSLDGSNGFAVEGLPYGRVGNSVHRAGDIDGDGVDDLVIGAPGAGSEVADGSTTGAGAAYVVYGRAGGFGTDGAIDVATLNGATGFRLATSQRFDSVGATVVGGADLNADGRPDLVIGAPGVGGGAGAYYVVFGRQGLGRSGDIDLSTLDGQDGFQITYSTSTPEGLPIVVPMGGSVGSTGDLNGDGVADLVLASNGQAFVLFGGSDLGFSGHIDLYQPGAAKVLTLDARMPNGLAPLVTGDAGDVNGDGIDDLMLGVGSAIVDGAPAAGTSYVVFGGAGLATLGTLALATLDGSNGFAMVGAGDAVSSAGDVNQDGFDDLLAGAPLDAVGAAPAAGKSYLVFGAAELGAGGVVALDSLSAGQALVIEGSAADDVAGSALAGVGDVNGDGIADLVVGAPQTVNILNFEASIAGSQAKYAVLDGNAWSAATALPDAARGAKGATSMQLLPDGELLLTWVANDPVDAARQQIHASFWDDGWSTPQLIATGAIDTAETPRLSQVNGQTAIVWTEILPDPVNSNDDQYRLYSSTFNGRSWSEPEPVVVKEALVPSEVYTDNLSLDLPQAGAMVRLATPHVAVGEQDSSVDIVVARTGDLSRPLTLHYATVDGAATAGADYDAASGTVTFAVGESEQAIRLRILDDAVAEKRGERFELKVWSTDAEAALNHGNLRLDRPAELRATITVMENEPTELAAIGSGFVLEADPQGGVGRAASSAGDLNKDGVGDFLIGAPGKNGGAGEVYVVYGSSQIGTADAGLSLDALDGTNGAILRGNVANGQGQAGIALAAADFDKNGVADIAIGAPQNVNYSGSSPGSIYVLSGDKIAGKAALDLSSSTAKELYTTTTYSLAGASLAAGDVNGDGKPDLVIGAPGMNQVFVVFGQTLAEAGRLNLQAMTSSQGFVLKGGTGQAGQSVAVADLDGNGVSDILVGAPFANLVSPANDPNNARGFGGQVYAVFGSTTIGKSGPIDLSKLNGTNGLVLQGQHFIAASDDEDTPDFTFADSAGSSVAPAGDINGDGKGDVVIGAPSLASGGVPSVGGAYVLFGGSSWKSAGATFQLAKVNGSNGFVATGVPSGSAGTGGTAGVTVTAAGDVNDDGIDDLTVGVPTLNTQGQNTNTGQTAILYGTRDWASFLDGNSIDLSDIPLDSRVFAYNGSVTGGNAGVAVANVGDLNADGLPDMFMGAPTSGEAYVSFGRAWMGPGGSMDVANIRSDNGFVFTPGSDQPLSSVRSAGDLNGDGYADLLVADPGDMQSSIQRFHIVFGGDAQVGAAPPASLTVDVSDVGSMVGEQTIGYGDFNSDGLADLVVATVDPGAIDSRLGSNFGRATIVFGSADPDLWSSPAGTVSLSSLQEAHGGVTISKFSFNGRIRSNAVASADVNGDGYDDLIYSVGQDVAFESIFSDNPTYVVFGKPSWEAGTVTTMNRIQALSDGGGFELTFDGKASNDYNTIEPKQPNALGDLNGDGYQDFGLTSTAEREPFGFVVFGSATVGSGGVVDLDTLDGTNGFRMKTIEIARNNSFHRVISAAGDVNGDGYDDFIVAETELLGTNAASHFVTIVFGKPLLGAGGTLDLSAIGHTESNDDGFYLTSATRQTLGYAVAAAGDVDGDGYADLLIGSPTVNGNTTGQSYVLYGAPDISVSHSVNVDQLDGGAGFIAVGAGNGGFSGATLTGPVDLNGDGFHDLSIGARGIAGVTPARVFAAFGGDFTGSTDYMGTAGNDVLQATTQATAANSHILNGRQGDDILQSVGSESNAATSIVMIGGEGNDILSIGGLSFPSIDGGSGDDTLMLNPYLLTSNDLDLRKPEVGNRIQGIETIDLGCDNRVTFRLVDLIALSDTTSTWTILGTGSLVAVPWNEAWVEAATPVEKDGLLFDSYSYKGATFLLQQGNRVDPRLIDDEAAAHADAYVVEAGRGLSMSESSGVLANDTVLSAATVALSSGPSHGEIELRPDGSFDYSPVSGFAGVDTFTYRATDAVGETTDGQAVIYVMPVTSGATLDLMALVSDQQVAAIYAGVLGRAADADGFDFWAGQLAGQDNRLIDIVNAVAASDEAHGQLPFLADPGNGSVGDFLAGVYDNLFGRAPDADGAAYWAGRIEQASAAGEQVGAILVDIMAGARDSAAGQDLTTLGGRIALGLEFVERQQEQAIAWAGDADTGMAQALLHGVSETARSLLMGLKQVDAWAEAHA